MASAKNGGGGGGGIPKNGARGENTKSKVDFFPDLNVCRSFRLLRGEPPTLDL